MAFTVYQSDARAKEKPCLRCGLSLRKLFDSTHCPQCGLSVWMSLNQNDVLGASNPPWLRTLSLGAWLLAAAQALGLAAYVLYMQGAEATATALGAVYLPLNGVALLLLARHERRWPDNLRVLRGALRVVAVLSLAGGPVLPACAALLPAEARPMPRPVMHEAVAPDDSGGTGYELPAEYQPLAARDVVKVIYELLFAASAVATFAYLRRLARRVPNHQIARICGILLFGPLISLFKVFPWVGLALSLGLARFVVYLPYVYLPTSILLALWFARTFRASAAAAQERWKAETVLPAAGAKGSQ